MRFSFFIALIIVFRVLLLLYFVLIDGTYIYPDSPMYIELADNLLNYHVFSVSQQAPFIPEVFRTPGYPAFLASIQALGLNSPYWTVFFQELVYGSAIVVFYHYGKSLFDRNILRASLLFLLLEPGGLAYPKLFLSETLFLPFLIGGVLSIGLYLRDSKSRYLILAGFLMGLGAIVRPAILYLPWIAAVVLIGFKFTSKRRWLDAGILVLIFYTVVSPWLARNYHYFGKAFMSGQQSHMLANYHVTKVWEHTKGLTQAQGQAEMQSLVGKEKVALENQLGRSLTPVEFFNLQQRVAISQLRQYPVDYIVQWLGGMIKTIAGPNLIEFYDILHIHSERPRLFATVENKGVMKGLWFYFKNMDYVFFVNALLTVLMGIFALFGAVSVMIKKDCFLWLILLANCYFISMAGPMGEPRFRMPVGVFWFVQAYLGFRWLVAILHRIQFGKTVENLQ